jgi:hypothetical protein
MKVVAIKDFKYSYNGTTVIEYLKDQIIEVDKIHYDKMLQSGYAADEKLETKVVEVDEVKTTTKARGLKRNSKIE